MAEYVLETKDLGISFGGLKAVENVDLKIKKKQLYGLVGPNGAGKTTVFNMLTGVYQPTTGTFYLNGEELRGKSQEQINHKGIARTFQNIRLFNNMSVIRKRPRRSAQPARVQMRYILKHLPPPEALQDGEGDARQGKGDTPHLRSL